MDAQAALSDKEYYHPQDPATTRSTPDWEDDPGAYVYIATMTAAVSNDGAQLSDSNDILAAFDDAGNVRGTSFALDVDFGPYEGTIVHEISLRSNDEGDHLTFKFYDASEDAVLDISENYSFVAEALKDIIQFENLTNKENLIPLLSVSGTLFAYFSIVIVNFGDFSRYVSSEKELKKGNLSLLLNLLFFLSNK